MTTDKYTIMEMPVPCDSRRTRTWKKTKIISVRTARWAVMIIHVPVAYVWIPLSCCFVAPTLKVAVPKYSELLADEYTTCMERAAGNMCGGGFMGLLALASCCCCLGKCCTMDPDDVFNNNQTRVEHDAGITNLFKFDPNN